jgi:hypothetical protein
VSVVIVEIAAELTSTMTVVSTYWFFLCIVVCVFECIELVYRKNLLLCEHSAMLVTKQCSNTARRKELVASRTKYMTQGPYQEQISTQQFPQANPVHLMMAQCSRNM